MPPNNISFYKEYVLTTTVIVKLSLERRKLNMLIKMKIMKIPARIYVANIQEFLD
jgi:hypothetical protein